MEMEDAASEISDWEVLSAASAHGDDEGDFVVLVSGEVGVGGGGGGDVLHDHFALARDPSDAGFSGEGEWLGELDEEEEIGEEGLGLVDGFDSVSDGRLDLLVAEEDWSERLQLELGGGVDDTIGEIESESSVPGAAVIRVATLTGGERREEAEKVGIEQEKDDVRSRGELGFAPPEVHHGTGENFNFDDAAVAADVCQFESPGSSDVQLEDGGAHVEASALGTIVEKEPVQGNSGNAASGCSEPHGEANAGSFPLAESLDGECSLPEAAAATGDAMGAVEEEPVQGNCGNAVSGAGEQGGKAKDGSLPLAQAPGTGEGERQVVWWRLPFRLLQCCAWKVKPIWSFSIAAALLGLIVLGRRMYRMRRKAQGLPQIKIAFDDKKASQFADRTARLNEAFFMARRVPMLRTASGAVFPWSMVQDR